MHLDWLTRDGFVCIYRKWPYIFCKAGTRSDQLVVAAGGYCRFCLKLEPTADSYMFATGGYDESQ